MVFLEGFLQCQLKQLLSCDAGTRFVAWITCIINAKAVPSALLCEHAPLETAIIFAGTRC